LANSSFSFATSLRYYASWLTTSASSASRSAIEESSLALSYYNWAT